MSVLGGPDGIFNIDVSIIRDWHLPDGSVIYMVSRIKQPKDEADLP